jgi:REP element-mobilizing transposase RayT
LPKKRPEYFHGGVYHIYNRGSHKALIFREPGNYLFVLRKIKHYLGELNLTLLVYCLMPNHFHFLIRQDGDYPAGLLSQRVFNSYSKAYNKRYQHSGTLFEGPYRVRMVTQTTDLLNLCRYIHVNPVKDGFAAEPGDWTYSNYLEWVGERDGDLVDRDFVNLHFGKPESYAEFVKEYLPTRKISSKEADYFKGFEK